MGFEIIWSELAIGQLKKLERPTAKRIYDAVTRLSGDPTRWVSRIVNSPHYKLRVGDYRVIIDIQRERLRILVIKLGHRKNIYARRA